jgi:phosphopantetheinyl transferase
VITAWLFGTALDAPTRKAYWLALPDCDREELSTRSPELRTRDAAIRWFLRSALGWPEGAVDCDAEGRPSIAGAATFSLSHSGSRALIATADQGLVGADLERLRPMPGARATTTRRFAEAEQSAILAAPDIDEAFLTVWTIKEAVAKAHGTGLRGALATAIDDPLSQSPRLLSPGPPLSIHPCPASLARRHHLRATIAAHPEASVTWRWREPCLDTHAGAEPAGMPSPET